MKNLKKALSLVLSTAMMLGMMVVGTGASYVDVDTQDNVEAIEVLKAAEIMVGDGDNFNPDDKVTREQMAVIMCNILDYNVAQYKGTAPFSDVSDWAEPFVAACYTHGIVSGIGDGKFGGQNDVSAAQAALMLMKALGYFQYQQDFGDDWQLATVREASKAGLYAGIDSSVEQTLTRNEVAQMVLNALEADMVEWSGNLGTEITTTDGTEIYIGYVAYYNALPDKDAYNYVVDDTADNYQYNTLQLIEYLYGDDFKKDTTSVNDDFGRPATQWKYKLETVGTFPEEPIATYTADVKKMTLYNLLGKSVLDDIVKSGSELTLEHYEDGGDTADTTVSAGGSYAAFAAKNDKTTAVGGNGTLTEVYLDDAGNVTIVEINTYLVEASGDYNAVKEELRFNAYDDAVYPSLNAGANVLSSDDFKGLEEIEDGDFLLITVADNEVYSIALADTLTGTVNGYTQSHDATAGKEITIDGTEYEYSAMNGTQNDETYAVGEQASLILDQYGYVIGVAEAMVASNFAYVMDAKNVGGLRGGEIKAVLAYTDGTTETVVINKLDATKAASLSADDLDNNWYAYSKTSDGSVNLMSTTTGYDPIGGEFTVGSSDTNKTIVNGETIVAYNTNYGTTTDDITSITNLNNAKTVLMVIDAEDDVTVYTGAEKMPVVLTAGSIADPADIFVKGLVKKSSSAYVAYMVVDLAEMEANEYEIIDTNAAPDFMFLLDEVRKVYAADGEVFWTYETLMSDGTIEKVTFDSTSAANQYNLIHKAHYNKDGYVASSTAVGTTTPYFNSTYALGGNAAQVVYANGALQIVGEASTDDHDFIVTDDTKIVLIAEEGTGLCKYTGVSYEVNEVKASYLESVLDGDYFAGRVAGKTVEANSNVLETLYVYVSATWPN